MREKPDLPEADIQDCLFEQYGLQAAELTFLPSGGDMNAVVYQVVTGEGTAYFLKLRRGDVDEISLLVPKFLAETGIRAVTAPIVTKSRRLWTRLADYCAILYPYVEGQNAFEVALTDRQWLAFGAALREVHSAVVPPELRRRIARETYAPERRERVKTLLERVRVDPYAEPTAAEYAGFLREKAAEIRHMVQQAEQLSSVLQAQPPPLVLCHSDLHAGNLLIEAVRLPADSRLYIVDWDQPIFAAKERDLMFIGGGVGSRWYHPREAELFYEGYGPAEINAVALAYYRFERIVQDIAEWGELVLLTGHGGSDRARALQGLRRWFAPHDVVEMAYQAERNLPPDLRSRSDSAS